MPSDKDVETLITTVQELASQSVKQEVKIGILTTSVDRMVNSVSEILQSNAKLEVKIEALQEKAVDKISNVEAKVNTLEIAHNLHKKRTDILELINSNTSGKNEVYANIRKLIADNWFKVVLAMGMLIMAVPSLLDMVAKHGS